MKTKTKNNFAEKTKRKCGLVLLDNSVRTCCSLTNELKFTSVILSLRLLSSLHAEH